MPGAGVADGEGDLVILPVVRSESGRSRIRTRMRVGAVRNKGVNGGW